jgi:muramoyltetrapeptide carboxypeptidase
MARTDAPLAKPAALKAGNQIRVVTPASPLTREKVQFTHALLEAEGYQVTYGQHCFDADHHLAGADKDRASDVMEAFLDPGVAAILCSRGGYGCARLFPYIDLDAMAASRKLFAGFSDITTLHAPLNRRGLPTLHAPMALTLTSPREEWVYESFKNALKGLNPIPAEAPRGQGLTAGTARGKVVGGCLCLVCDTIGTPEEIELEGNILVLEDVDESPHRVDAMLTHLVNTGNIQRTAGIVVGEMTRSDERVDEGIGGKPWREIVKDRLGALGVPVMVDFPFGHNRNMLTLPLGVMAEMDAAAGTLTYLESHCE